MRMTVKGLGEMKYVSTALERMKALSQFRASHSAAPGGRLMNELSRDPWNPGSVSGPILTQLLHPTLQA